MKNKNIWTGFSRKERKDKIDILKENGFLDEEYSKILQNNVTLPPEIAEQMAENTLSTFALPFSIASNFLIDGKETAVPMVTEEPSVIAACSYAAKLISRSGGFSTSVINREMIGQVVFFNVADVELAIENITKNKEKILKIADNSHPSIINRGGGARDIRFGTFCENDADFFVIYLIADVSEAMGANIINNMLEGIKPFLAELTGGSPLMAILSNYATESLVTSQCEIDIKYLSNDIKEAENIAKKIHLASIFSKVDIYRASTHNKGIFNGIDAIVIAVGNDWRAIEAGGHAFAARSGRYEGLTTWEFNTETGKIRGELTLPMPIASIGGSIGLNPTVKAAFSILGHPDARTLSTIIVSVGLAQNFAALKALVSTGIQKGHMKLHSRSLALLAGASHEEIDLAVEKLINSKHINLETATHILNEIRNKNYEG